MASSATYTLPLASTATPNGYRNRAAAPVPSALPLLPVRPASVVTTPPDAIFRIARLFESATYTLPALSTATPAGPLKRAAAPVPSAVPGLPAVPASVVTTPPDVIIRIVWLPVSPTYTLPAASTATPTGALKCAPSPVPSVLPLMPASPANVVTTPAALILRIV